MNKKKRILYIVAACTLSFAQMGCSDLLDQAPQGELIDTDLVGGTYESEIFRNVRRHARLCPDIGNNRTLPSTASVRKTRKKAVHRQTERVPPRCMTSSIMTQVTVCCKVTGAPTTALSTK